MIIVEGHVRLSNPDDFGPLQTAAAAQIEASKAETGCLDYSYAIDLLDPSLMRVLERWESWDALEAHFKMPHMNIWREALKDVSFSERVIRAHEVAETRSV